MAVVVEIKGKFADVTCPVCRLPRSISRRQAHRIGRGKTDGRCRSCRHPQPERLPPDDEDRLYWLARFDDEEIVEMATAYYGRGKREAVAAWRARLAITAGP
ncbi:MAG: hypothetical protein H0T97_00675 [Actinobacteria bacterium]|nr:hypothetical protein [Actinomycetota bacterium]